LRAIPIRKWFSQNGLHHPEASKRDHCLHRDTFQNVIVNVVSEFVGQHCFDLVIGVIREQGIGQHDASGLAQPHQRSIRLL